SGRACRVLLVGGGTGGHVSPLLAVAEALTEKDPETLFLFIGGRRGLEAELVAGSGIPFHATAMPSLRDPDWRFSLVSRAAVVPIATADALAQILRFKPNVCCTTGGLASFPVVVAARLARVPVYIWEGNAIPGRVNRMLAAWSQRIGATFEGSLRVLPRGRTFVDGNPIRRSLLTWTRELGRAKLGIPSEGPVVFVTGGSQGSAAINHAVSGAAEAHQMANAQDIAERGAAIVIRESQLDADRLVAQVTGLLDDPARLGRMAKAARAVGRPDAATAIARELRKLGGCA